jgi:two-component sensor histidine kinase
VSETLWARRQPPDVGPGSTVWDGRPCTAEDVTVLRRYLRTGFSRGARPSTVGDDDIERLLLAFEELTSNALRHGRPPVRVVVTTAASGWLVDVSDTATDRPPAPAVDGGAGQGGLGLHLVAGLCIAHGWTVDGDRKHVWAHVECCPRVPTAPSIPVPRSRDETSGRHLDE